MRSATGIKATTEIGGKAAEPSRWLPRIPSGAVIKRIIRYRQIAINADLAVTGGERHIINRNRFIEPVVDKIVRCRIAAVISTHQRDMPRVIEGGSRAACCRNTEGNRVLPC